MVPFKSLGTVSYSPSIVTMAVFAAILEIFSVKEWPDLEIWVWGPSRSLRMARFDRPCVMYNVLSGLAACGRLGVAARPACLFVTRSGTRPAARVARTRRQQTESVECQ